MASVLPYLWACRSSGAGNRLWSGELEGRHLLKLLKTDENAFRALVARGIGIVVAESSRPTAASYALHNPHEVRWFLRRLIVWLERQRAMLDWTLVYENFDPERERLREALCTLANGYFATRGAGEEATADGIHYPGTYLAGGYNRLDTEIAGRVIENEDLVNLPN